MNPQKLFLLALLSLSLTACGGSDNNDPVETPDTETGTDTGSGNESGDGDESPDNEEGDVYGPYSTGSTSEPQTVYFDLDTQQTLALTDTEAATNTEWDIAFRRTNVFMNTAQEVPVSLYFTGNNGDFYDDNGTPVADMFLAATADSELEDYLAVTATDIPADDSFVTDTETQVIGDSFYNYDMTTHTVSAATETYYIVSSDDNYSKFNITDITTTGRSMATITFAIAHQSAVDGAGEFAGPVELTVDAQGCTDDIFIDFDLQQTVTAADNWDVSLSCTDSAADFSLTLADDATVLRTDADSYGGVDAEAAAFYGFTPDDVTSYAMSEWPWYYYDGSSHLLYSQYGVYLVKTGDKVFKFQITSYYDEAGTSGSYSVRADELVAE